MTEDQLTVVSMAVVAVVVIVSRWGLRVRRGEWQTGREIAFVGLLVGGLAGVAAVGAAEPDLRSALLGGLAVGSESGRP